MCSLSIESCPERRSGAGIVQGAMAASHHVGALGMRGSAAIPAHPPPGTPTPIALDRETDVDLNDLHSLVR